MFARLRDFSVRNFERDVAEFGDEGFEQRECAAYARRDQCQAERHDDDLPGVVLKSGPQNTAHRRDRGAQQHPAQQKKATARTEMPGMKRPALRSTVIVPTTDCEA